MTDTSTTPNRCLNCVKLEARIAALEAQVRELTALLKQNSGNSSKPPSSDPPFNKRSNTRPKSDRKPGGQPGHMGCTRKPLPPEAVTEVQIHLPLKCGGCGHRLPKRPGKKDSAPKRHQVVEIPPFDVEVIEHQAHGRHCPSCGKVTWGEIPAEIRGQTFGPRLTALISHLSGRCQLGKRVIQELLEDLLRLKISLGSLSRKEREVSEALESAWVEAKQAVQEAPVKNADETGWYLTGKLKWLWVGTTPKVAVFQVQDRRNQEAMKELLGETPLGIVGSDRFGAYTEIPLEQRQLCWAHLKRDFQGLVDSGSGKGGRVGKNCLRVLKEVFEEWGEYRAGKVGRRGLQRRMEPLKNRMRRWLKHGREGPLNETSRFCGRVLKLYEGFWTFVRAQGVEPTNNMAERDLRIAVLWRKKSYGNRSLEGCRFSERILTAVQTLRKQKRNVLDYLTRAVEAHRAKLTAPSLLLLG